MRIPSLFLLLHAALLAQAPPASDISGTWIAKLNGPMGEIEMVWSLKMSPDGKLSGSQRMPFGDSPIVSGQVTGDQFDFVVEQEMFGNISRRETKGKILSDGIEITPAMPGPPPGMGPGGPGGPGSRRMAMGPLLARRGTPAPSFRAASVDYKSLPKLDLPTLKPVPRFKLAQTPPMGWNSWNKFRANVSDKLIRETVDAMISSGMRDAGYIYVNIDDGWQSPQRDDKGILQPNSNFPDMRSLANYVHAKGMKLGIYSSPGPTTCGGFLGSYGHEDIDAKTWAAWGIDYLKYDWCSASRVWKDEDMQAVYQRMGEALQKAGRPMVYALCQFGRAKVTEWGTQVGAHLWRTTFDIRDSWDSMSAIGFAQSDLASASGPASFNDPDMLEVGNGGMNQAESKTHFSLWAMIPSPLLAGHDVRAMTLQIREILLHQEVIAINQDPLGLGARRILQHSETEVWMKEAR
ncbi:MAG: glycoside hydrolase family 27 protein [Acidobacteria bacterium]|nr:glycoside hydrolase family 27 protein [Acidobacteriota bacterium]